MPHTPQNDLAPFVNDRRVYRVLLFSSSELVCFSLEKYLADSGFLLTTVARREEVVERLEKENFSAAIFNIDSDHEEGFRLRQELREGGHRLPILFMTPLLQWARARLLDRIVEDPHSYYIPENVDREFILGRLRQVIHACEAESELNQLKSKIDRNWFLASLLQQAMLPPWVYFSRSYEFSCFYKPFAKVSGDLFEWLPLDEDRALFIFGDISGHGTHSALAMAAVQSFLKQVVLFDKERATRPNLIASDINEFFCQHLHNIVYMSTLIAYIDFRRNFLRYQNAGYMDIICVDAETGRTACINPENRGSIPLGMVRNVTYTDEENVEYHFSDSSVFLFCSDGLMDLAKDSAGEDHMDMDMAMKLAGMLIRDTGKEERSVALPCRYCHALEQFGYLHPQDDLSLILIRKPRLTEREHTFSCRVPADKIAVDRICEQVSEFVARFYRDEEISVNAELLLAEYLVNVILHGLNEYEKLNEYIAVKICAYENELKLIVWDHGKEWDGLFMSQEKAKQSLDELNENMIAAGRGIPIISMIASQISRQRYCGLNESIFIIPCKL